MRIEQLYYFKEVAYTKSIIAAAEHLFISQQSLSDAIARLEKEFHLQLFDRIKKGVLLTAASKEFLQESLKMLDIYDNLFTIGQTPIEEPAQLRIASDRHFNNSFFEHIIKIYKKHLPYIQLTIQEELWTVPIVEKLLRGEIDIGISTTHDALLTNDPLISTNTDKAFKIHPLMLDNLYIIAHKECPLLHQKTVTMDDVLSYPLVLDADPNLISILEHTSQKHKPNIFMTSSSLRVQLQAIQGGLGLGFANGLTLKYGNFDMLNISALPIEEAVVKMVAFIPLNQKSDQEIATFIDLFGQYLNHKIIL